MTTQNGSNELRVIEDADIEKDLNNFGIVDIGVTIFIPDKEIEKGETGSGNGTSDGASVSGTKIGFGDGKVTTTNILVPIQNAMSVPVADLNENKKDKIKKRAEDSKNKADKDRDGIGE